MEELLEEDEDFDLDGMLGVDTSEPAVPDLPPERQDPRRRQVQQPTLHCCPDTSV